MSSDTKLELKVALWVLENSHLVDQMNCFHIQCFFLFPEFSNELISKDQAPSDFHADNLPGTVAAFFLFEIHTHSLEVTLHSQSGVLTP